MEKQVPLWNRDFIGMCLCNFFLFMTVNTLITTLPLYVINVLKQSEKEIGLTLMAFTLGAIFVRFFAGKWIDELGKKKILIASLLLFAITNIAYLGINSIFLLLVLRILHGAAFGMVSTATMAIASEIPSASRKGEGISYFTLSMSLSMVLGPLIGLMIVSTYNFTVLFAICSVYTIAAFLFAKMAKVEEVPVPNFDKTKRKLKWESMIEKKALPIAFVCFVLILAQSTIQSYVPIYAESLGLGNIAGYFFVMYAVMLIATRSFTGRIFDKFGANYVVYPSLVIYFLGWVGLSFVQSPFAFLAMGAVIGIGYGTLQPSFITLVTASSPSERRGVATSTFYLFFDIGMGVGAVLLGIVAFYTNYQMMYLVCAGIVVVATFFYYKVQLSTKKDVGAGAA
ncbi:MFS transporter [Halalkalibacter alkaliphilus]|uniref:MFS transporter n=1 Tax=Halalkalibacter alkaliphilus TaxID=2917993 RepID=A0A9X2CUE1_9BACI|nr:MFS transporter [Halalkalibacter alkaliphilus]MCL7748481.1 MFS transporter [Halalkalibacter alkaliphilus]